MWVQARINLLLEMYLISEQELEEIQEAEVSLIAEL